MPFIFPCSEAEFSAGTLVRHVAMDVGKYKSGMTNPTGSLWWLAHHYLFDPVMPFTIADARGNLGSITRRTVTGNVRRLNTSENVEYERSADRVFNNGSIRIRYWVFSTSGEKPQNYINNFTSVSKPLVITFNGQKQGELPNTVIKNELKLPFLEKYIVVQISCDKMDGESRRQLFSTTRESLRDTSILDNLRAVVIETLQADDELKRLDSERKKNYIQKTDLNADAHLRKRLTKRITEFLKSFPGEGVGGNQPGNTPTGGPTEEAEHGRTKAVPIPSVDPPTFIDITNAEPRKVYPGRSFTLKFKTDADSRYFQKPDTFLAIVKPSNAASYTGTAKVIQGHGTVFFRSPPEAQVGQEAEVILEVRPESSTAIRDSIKIEFVEAPAGDNTSGAGNAEVNIDTVWVTSDSPYWTEHNWTQDSVADVASEKDSVTVFVSSENKRLASIIARATRKESQDEGAVQTIRDFYLEHIAFYAVILDVAQRKLSQSSTTIEQASFDESLSELREQEMDRVNELVCGMMSQMFDAILANSDKLQLS